MTNAQILRQARALIKKGWCKKVIARTKTGACTYPDSRYACAWCAEGAIQRACKHKFRFYVMTLVGIVKRENKISKELHQWNDAPRRTKDDVLRAFDRAIKYAEKHHD